MATSWLITGANSGFGRIMTEALLKRGDRVAATYRSDGALDDLLQAYPDRLSPVRMDLADSESIDQAVAEAFQALGKIDIIISNAGYGTFGALEELSRTQIRRQIETNLIGSICFIQALLPHLRQQGSGRILQVSSEGGRIAYPGFSLYHASKWGQEGFIEAIAQEVAPFGIQMGLLEPGPTGTNFLTGIDLAQPSAAYEQSPVGALRTLLESGEFSTTMGDPVKVAHEMIAIAQADVLPLRTPLGSIAWDNINGKLEERHALLKTQKAQAYRCDVEAK
jgi:NAD(P)-dependent dehydrogenase (short-subunit alcohol dehydrogenase family)